MANLPIYKNINFKQNRVSKKKLELNMIEFAMIFPLIYLDETFQRWYRWSALRGQEFIISAFRGLGNVDIRVVCIHTALTYSKSIGHIESIQYFENLKSQGYLYVSIDGNSRSTYNALQISGFSKQVLSSMKGPLTNIISDKYNLKIEWNPKWMPMDKKFTQTIGLMTKINKKNKLLPSFALYQIQDRKTIEKQNFVKYNGGKNKIQLDDNDILDLLEMYDYFTKNVVFSVEVWEKLKRKDLNDLFINYNKNEKISKQDFRNALDCDMSDIVHNLPNDLKKCLELNMSVDTILTRGHHEMIGMCMMYLQHETPLKNGRAFNSSGQLDKFWIETRQPSFTDFENSIWNVFIKLADVQLNSLKSNSLFLDIFAIAKWMVQNNISTSLIDEMVDENNKKIGWENIMKLHTKWTAIQLGEGAKYYLGKGKVDWTAYRGGIKSFCNEDWVVSLEDFLTKNRESAGLIKKNVREDVNKVEIRLALWNKQNGIDPSTGKKIPFSDVLNTNRNSGYEVDHIDPLDKGGFNEFYNLQLISGTLNAQKNNKSNYQFQIEEN
jgi:hypothetical protein